MNPASLSFWNDIRTTFVDLRIVRSGSVIESERTRSNRMRPIRSVLHGQRWVLGGLTLAFPLIAAAASQPSESPSDWEDVDVRVRPGGAERVLEPNPLNWTHELRLLSSSTRFQGTMKPPEPASGVGGTVGSAPPLVTPGKPLAPVPAQAAPQQAGTGPVLPPSNVKFAMDCQLKGINAPVGDAYQPSAEVRPKIPWVNPPSTARIGVTVINPPPNYTASTFQYFKLPKSLWQPGGPHARVALPTIKVLNVLVSRANQPSPPFALATCTATADAAPDSITGYPLTP